RGVHQGGRFVSPEVGRGPLGRPARRGVDGARRTPLLSAGPALSGRPGREPLRGRPRPLAHGPVRRRKAASMGAEGTGGGVGHRSAPVGRAVAAAALVGLGWPAVLLLATGMLMPFTDKPHAWDGGETAAVIVPSLGAPALAVLPVAWLLRRLRVPSPLAVAATGLLLACPVAVGLVAVASAELRPDLTALTAV